MGAYALSWTAAICVDAFIIFLRYVYDYIQEKNRPWQCDDYNKVRR